MQTVVLAGVLEKLDYAWALKVCGAATLAVEIAAHGAGHAVFVYLAYVYEEVTVLSAAVIPLLKDFGGLWEVRPEAFGDEEAVASGVA
ncbi:MAG: hypothetical protein FJ023_03500 [Chloroflexi bacterium]|nr:hypothetical protein [Chloroflexota bacterium]